MSARDPNASPAALALVRWSIAKPWRAIAIHAALAAAALLFVLLGGFKITTDADALLSPKLPYRQAEQSFRTLFPGSRAAMLVVIDAQTPELAEGAAQQLAQAMGARPDLFQRVRRGDPEVLRQNGLLFSTPQEVTRRTDDLVTAAPFLGALAADPSLRGVAEALANAGRGVVRGEAELSQLDQAASALQAPLAASLSGQPAPFSWQTLLSSEPPAANTLRKLVLADPVPAPGRLRAGADASAFVRAQAQNLGFTPEQGVRVRLTGPQPLADDEFASLAENIWLTAAVSLSAILLMVWLAVRSVRATLLVIAATATGLLVTMAAGLVLFGRFNAISVAFIPLFVGLGIDFCIQVCVRARAEQAPHPAIRPALERAALAMGRSLFLAAAAITAGFLAFVPTRYVGVSQLGAIAGLGMLVALFTSLTLLPALLTVWPPKSAPPREDLAWLEAADRWLHRCRTVVIWTAAAAALASLLAAPRLMFDFNPLHLRSEKTESVSTLIDLTRDPNQNPDALSAVASDLEQAQRLAAELEALPEVERVLTLQSFIPENQEAKLPAIEDAAFLLGPELEPIEAPDAPTDAQTIASLTEAAAQLRAAANAAGPAPALADSAQRQRALAEVLESLAAAPQAARERAQAALIFPLTVTLDQIRTALQAQPLALETLPEEFQRQWLGPDGRARLSILPAGDTNDTRVREAFVEAVRSVAPNASGPPVAQIEAGRIVVGAFVLAGVLSFLAILVILYIALGRAWDVFLTLLPIVLTALLTLATTVALGVPLNFANIIALPLLFGMSVAFHIYFTMAWRKGEPHALTSPLARAVLFSALSSATGFGALWLSSHPGTASMGELLMISLTWTLISGLLVQPALMGPPRRSSAA